jgi:hypothetical protein
VGKTTALMALADALTIEGRYAAVLVSMESRKLSAPREGVTREGKVFERPGEVRAWEGKVLGRVGRFLVG